LSIILAALMWLTVGVERPKVSTPKKKNRLRRKRPRSTLFLLWSACGGSDLQTHRTFIVNANFVLMDRRQQNNCGRRRHLHPTTNGTTEDSRMRSLCCHFELHLPTTTTQTIECRGATRKKEADADSSRLLTEISLTASIYGKANQIDTASSYPGRIIASACLPRKINFFGVIKAN
jgi:hypothetical protein